MRSRHGSARPAVLISSVTAWNGRTNADTWSKHLGFHHLETLNRVDGIKVIGGTPVGVGGILSVLLTRRTNASYIARAGRVADSVKSGRSRITAVGCVAVGEHWINTSSLPTIDDFSEPGVIGLTAVAPGVVDHVRAHIRVWIGTSQVGWGCHEFATTKQGNIPATSIRAACAGHPFSSGSDADLI